MNTAAAAWKLRRAEEEATLLLRAALKLDPSVVDRFPRPLEDILAACLPSLLVYRRENLSQVVVRNVLWDQHSIIYGEDGDCPLAGFTYAGGNLVIVFLETRHGKDFELFTLAHEAGHIAIEYLPKLQARNQLTLFGESATPISAYFHRGLPEDLLAGRVDHAKTMSSVKMSLDARQASGDAWLREVKANACAAELLAPASAVRERLRSIQGDADRVAAMRQSFGLSRSAAQIRLRELGLLADDTTLGLFD